MKMYYINLETIISLFWRQYDFNEERGIEEDGIIKSSFDANPIEINNHSQHRIHNDMTII
jgi:hypothetical protein